MSQIDRIHMAKPFLESRRIVDEFADLGRTVNRKRVSRLMRLMGIQAIYPGPKTSQPIRILAGFQAAFRTPQKVEDMRNSDGNYLL